MSLNYSLVFKLKVIHVLLMRDSLKEKIERIIGEVLDYALKEPGIKRIIVTDSRPRIRISGSDLLNMSYTHNRFLNRQPVIDKRIRVELIFPYNQQKDGKEGDYIVEINYFLTQII